MAMFAVKAFSRDKGNSHTQLELDNRTPVAYVNHMEDWLSSVAIQLWTWCLEKGITLSAKHLPGVDNCMADQESWTIHSSAEWQLSKDIFVDLMQEVHQCMFASCLNYQLSQFISWRPDPVYYLGTDALKMPWTRWRGYTFLLISKVLKRSRRKDQEFS